MAELMLNNVFVNYFGAKDVIHSFSHSFKSGLNVIYGENGSGKTTLLKTIAGLVKINAGEISFNGVDYSEVHIKDKEIAMVFDDLALRERKSARFNLELPLKLRKIPSDTISERVNAVIREFGLSENMLNTSVFRLSQEIKIRLSLARAFIRDSKIIIFDNPFFGLSSDLREELFLLLLGKIRQSNQIIIYATDNSREAEMTLADTIILSFGYLTDKGFPEDFRKTPKSLCTAEKFIRFASSYNIELEKNGSFNLLNGRFSIENIKNKLIGDNYLGKEVIAVIPPRAVVVGEGIEGKVVNLIDTPFGRLAIIEAKNDTINAFVANFIMVGDKIKFDIDTDKIFLFDTVNEKSIIDYNKN